MQHVIGIDEAGRGALAGPVAVGAVMIPAHLSWDDFEGLRDSKKLSPKRREAWFEHIKVAGFPHAAAMTDAPRIDTGGIVPACLTAAEHALKQIAPRVGEVRVLCDAGLSVPGKWQQESIVRGDEREVAIALASIVAKVTRDRFMVELSGEHPQYAFEKHKGYGTKMHREAIISQGFLVNVHRKTFLKRLTA